ncbi:MAG: alkaline phosphatase [Flavobacteriaceae bacterium]|nr:MAG: alkaline phosphatase [Flavobacteriaceae bacterium]
MKIYKLLLAALVFTMVACTQTSPEKPIKKQPVNVILLIADGTGLSQVSSMFFYKDSTPNYARFKNIGLIKTSSSQQLITDSAAGATAFACGVKTYNGAIAVADDSSHVKTIIELITSKNIKTGLIATSSITHATPASFYAHTLSRDSSQEIASYLPNSGVDFFAGGGITHFNKREDGQDLLQKFESEGVFIDTTSLGSFSSINKYDKVGYLLAKDHMKSVKDGRGDFLSKATALGLEFLSKDAINTNFFLMVEGSQVDWGGHANDGDYLVSELIDFDDAVGIALDYAEKDGNTLVIVTADHETGGFTLGSTSKKTKEGKDYSDYNELNMIFSTHGHSATLVPVFAYGPGSENFTGIYENTAIFDKIMEFTGWNK